MSIANRINEIRTHLTNDWNSVEAITGATSLDKNIENIASVLDNLYEELPKVTGTGTDLSLSTRAGKMKLSLKGNTSQTGTPTPDSPIPVNVVSGDNEVVVCGKNIFNDCKKTTTEIGGITISTNDNGAKLNGTYDKNNVINLWLSESANGTINNAPLLKPNTNYAISIRLIDGTMSSTNFPCYISSTINNTFSWNYKTLTYSDGMWGTTFTTGNEDTYISGVRFNLETNKEVTFTNAVIGIQIEENNSITSFEKHQESNYPIHLGEHWLGWIGDYQDKFIRNSGKNYCSSVTKPINANLKFAFGNNIPQTITISFTTNEALSNNSLYLEIDGTSYGIVGTITASANTLASKIVTFSDENYQAIKNGTDIVFVLFKSGANFTIPTDAMINKGTTALPYEPYGDGDWYKEGKIGKVVLDGSEYWIDEGGGAPYALNLDNFYKNNSMSTVMSNYYYGTYWDANWNNYSYLVSANTAASNIDRVKFKNVDISSLADWKTWLGTHNTIVYYVLKTPTYTKITDTNLLNQLNAVYRANSYKGQTNINQVNNDLPFELDVSALEG